MQVRLNVILQDERVAEVQCTHGTGEQFHCDNNKIIRVNREFKIANNNNKKFNHLLFVKSVASLWLCFAQI